MVRGDVCTDYLQGTSGLSLLQSQYGLRVSSAMGSSPAPFEELKRLSISAAHNPL